jgi:ribonucleoside-diphosphate reductase alpha chain
MSTSVIDFIFRDLAISYLKRSDLGQIKPEDLLDNSPRNEGEKRPGAKRSRAQTAPEKDAPGFTVSREAPSPRSPAAKIAEARVKGYEGDPCPVCASFTLVRNGACMKCDTCGATTGCS